MCAVFKVEGHVVCHFNDPKSESANYTCRNSIYSPKIENNVKFTCVHDV